MIAKQKKRKKASTALPSLLYQIYWHCFS